MSQVSHDASVVVSATGVSFGSVCSGIEAASVAWEPMGWKAAWFAEIEAFPSAVLAHHWPQVQNLGDMTKIRDRIAAGEISAPDVLVGGTPCQAFSVAGARKSLDDDRGQLTLEYVRLLNEIDAVRSIRGEHPAVTVWENVPGVLSTKDNAFGCFLGALAGEECELQPTGKKWTNAGCVFGPQRAVAWRILDAQYFGVAQRRRRVFVVASAREGFNSAEVLFELEGVRRDTPPSRSAGQDATRSTGKGFASSSFAQCRPVDGDGATIKASGGDLGGGSENLIASSTVSGGNATEPMDNIAPCLTKTDRHATAYSFDSLASNSMKSSNPHSGCREVDLAKTIDTTVPCPSKNQGGIGILQSECYGIQGSMIGRSLNAGPQGSGISDDVSFTLTKGDRHGVAYTLFEPRSADGVPRIAPDQTLCPTLNTMRGRQREPCIATPSLVRRLTPIECERLQGFPDNHTQIPYRNKSADLCPDGPRYAACGNSMAVPVMAWIGKRIEDALNELKTNDNRKTPATANS